MDESSTGNAWPSEDYYLRYLRADRRLYAWCLVRLTGIVQEEAWRRAVERYPYETPDTPFRGLIHHGDAWKWISRDLFPDYPGCRRLEEFGLTEEYEKQAEWYHHGEPNREPLVPDQQ